MLDEHCETGADLCASSQKKILVVDDSPHMLRFIATLLKREDFQVVCLARGEAVLEQCSEEDFDLIVIDEQMPGLTGRETIAELRQKNIKTPAILCTGESSACENISPLFVDAMTKPMDVRDLVGRVKRYTAYRC